MNTHGYKPQSAWNYVCNPKINSLVAYENPSNFVKREYKFRSQTRDFSFFKGGYSDNQKSLSKTKKISKNYSTNINSVVSKKKKKGVYGFCFHCKFYGQPIQWRFADEEKVCNSCGLHYNKLKNRYRNQPEKANFVFKMQEKMGSGHKRGNHHLELPENYEEIIKKFQKNKSNTTSK